MAWHGVPDMSQFQHKAGISCQRTDWTFQGCWQHKVVDSVVVLQSVRGKQEDLCVAAVVVVPRKSGDNITVPM